MILLELIYFLLFSQQGASSFFQLCDPYSFSNRGARSCICLSVFMEKVQVGFMRCQEPYILCRLPLFQLSCSIKHTDCFLDFFWTKSLTARILLRSWAQTLITHFITIYRHNWRCSCWWINIAGRLIVQMEPEFGWRYGGRSLLYSFRWRVIWFTKSWQWNLSQCSRNYGKISHGL